MAWQVTLRLGPKVRKAEAASLDEAIETLRSGLARAPRRDAVDLRVRTFEPIQQVAARGELIGPRRARGGVDVRGDGSAEAFTGKLRRRVVELQDGEDAFSALRRALDRPA